MHLQMFHVDIAKVDRDVAYVASVCSKCFICFPEVYCKYVYLDVAYVSHICCKCFIWMLRIFYNGFEVFLQVFHMHVSSVSFAFIRMFQMLHLDVSKVNRVLHMLQWDPLATTYNSC